MDIKELQAKMDKAREATKKVYPERENNDGWVKNDTFTTLRQAHIPNSVLEFRILPDYPGRNPGMFVVQKHKILESYGTRPDGSQYPNYVQVLGNVTNPEMTIIDSIIADLVRLERTQNAKWKELDQGVLDLIKAFKGETHIEVPCIFRAQHENRPFKIGNKSIDSWYITKADKNNYIGKIFQMRSPTIYGSRMKDELTGQWTDNYDGIMGIKNEWGDIDSLGEDGLWLKLTTAGKTPPGKTQKGFPSYKVDVTKDRGPLPDSLAHFMDPENYPDLYKKNEYYKKSNDDVLGILKGSKFVEVLESLGFVLPSLQGTGVVPLPF